MIPTIDVLAQQFSALASTAGAWGVVLTAVVLVVIQDWRVSITALAVQYMLVGMLFTQVLTPALAGLQIVVGLLACLVLALTARHVAWGRRERRPVATISGPARRFNVQRWLPTGLPFRLVAALMVVVAAYTIARRPGYQLPEVSDFVNMASYMLMALGLLALGLTEEPLKAGLGLLTFLAGFQLFYYALEQALVLIGFFGAASLMLALATAHLTAARAAALQSEGGR
jgi:hypothetical protein